MSAVKKAKPGLLGSITLGHFGARDKELSPADPLASAVLILEVDDIEFYDRNPRQVDNAAYEQIRDSIRAVGMDQPIVVTRRPGSEKFMVARGGNTRLKVLKELWMQERESGTAANWKTCPCVFKPWTSEVDVLAAHLRENDLRADLLFIDHAHAVMALKALLEEEEGKEFTERAYETRLAEMGHRVNRRDLNRMQYAVRVLDPLIPTALRGGTIGPKAIDKISNLRRSCLGVYIDLMKGSTPDTPVDTRVFDTIFQNALSAHDGEVLDFAGVCAELDQKLSDLTGVSPQKISLYVNCHSGMGTNAGMSAVPDAVDSGDSNDGDPLAVPATPLWSPGPAQDAALLGGSLPAASQKTIQQSAPARETVPVIPAPDPAAHHRAQAQALALQLASSAGVGHLVRPDTRGIGFSMSVGDDGDSPIWWLLAYLSGTVDTTEIPLTRERLQTWIHLFQAVQNIRSIGEM